MWCGVESRGQANKRAVGSDHLTSVFHFTHLQDLHLSASAYETHYAAIRAAAPADRLLEYKLGSGWGPLCKFSGKSEPDAPFPHRNDANTLEQPFVVAIKKAFLHSLWNLSLVVGGLAFVVGFGRSSSCPFPIAK